MSMRNLLWSLLVLAALALSAGRASAIGFILSETKEELKLKYDVTIHDHGNGRVGVEFTLVDEGRLAPLFAVNLSVPTEEKDKKGGYSMDLFVTLELKKSADGKRTAWFEMRKDWAERAEISLSTRSLDGKELGLTSYIYVIPVSKYLKLAAAAPEGGAPAAAPAAPPSATPAATPPATSPPAATPAPAPSAVTKPK